MADDSKYPTRIAPYGLRMPPDLKERVQEAADKAGRSLHAELIHTLEEKYPVPLVISREDYEKFLKALEARAEELQDPEAIRRQKANIEQLRQFALYGGPTPDYIPNEEDGDD